MHFDEYENNLNRRNSVNKINEMERMLNKLTQEWVEKIKLKNGALNLKVLNPFKGNNINHNFHTEENKKILQSIIKKLEMDFNSKSTLNSYK